MADISIHHNSISDVQRVMMMMIIEREYGIPLDWPPMTFTRATGDW